MKDRKELIRKVAYKIWEITGKGDDRTLQNWLDAEDIVNMILSYYKENEEEKTEFGCGHRHRHRFRGC